MSTPAKQLIEQTNPDQVPRSCPLCTEPRPVTDFSVNRARQDGISLYCRTHTREQRNASRRRLKDYRAAQKRRQEAQQAPVPVTDRVLEYLQQEGAGTQKQIHNATRIPLSEIDVALTELQIDRRCVGSRPQTDNVRIYFCL